MHRNGGLNLNHHLTSGNSSTSSPYYSLLTSHHLEKSKSIDEMVDVITTDDSSCESRTSTMGGAATRESSDHHHHNHSSSKTNTSSILRLRPPVDSQHGLCDNGVSVGVNSHVKIRNNGSGVGGGGDGGGDDDAATVNTSGQSVEIGKCIFLFVFLFLAGISNWAVIAYTHDIVPREPLPDIVFGLIDEQPWASLLGDICVATCLLILAALFFIHQHRWTILKRVVFCAACLYTMRSITLTITQLPSGYKNNTKVCRERVESEFGVFINRLVEQTIRVGFQSKNSMLCGDLLFSGHTLVMVICSLSVAYYLPRSIKPIQWISHIACFIGMICMIISRTHYTIDVVIAYWLSNFVFRIYHAYCEVDMCMERQKSILFSWWPCRIIDWLETNIVPGRLENRICFLWQTSSDGNISSSESSTSDTRQHTKQVSISSSSTYPI